MNIDVKEMFTIGRMILEKYADRADNKIFGSPEKWEFKIRSLDSDTLGYCNYVKREIVLSEILVNHGTKEEIVDTLLHELAHAFAGIERTSKRYMGHGKLWKSWARRLGCDARAECVMSPRLSEAYKEAFPEKLNKKPKYYIVHDKGDSVERRGSCNRRLKDLAMRGYKNEPKTIGHLWMIRPDDLERANGDMNKIRRMMFR